MPRDKSSNTDSVPGKSYGISLARMRARLLALRELERQRLVCRDDISELRVEYVRDYVEVYCVTSIGSKESNIHEHIKLDNESKELILVGYVYAIAGNAGQIYRQHTNSDHGIDGEIEFKDDNGEASGKRLYLQLKSGDSYLRKRRKDGVEVFRIKKKRHTDYWQGQAYPVMLVIRTSDEIVRWMDVAEYLRKETAAGTEKVKQVLFEGEELTVESLLRMRENVFGRTD